MEAAHIWLSLDACPLDALTHTALTHTALYYCLHPVILSSLTASQPRSMRVHTPLHQAMWRSNTDIRIPLI